MTLALGLASAASTSMVIVRYAFSGQAVYRFLVWNLFLAWLPFCLALAAFRHRRRPLIALGLGFLWLLFFPNAPYIVTDVIHLKPLGHVPLWYDGLMIFSFALTGLLLGFISLAVMQGLVSQQYGRLVGWLFVLFSLGLGSVGVYIGRFLRWNSWDVFFNPLQILYDLLDVLLNPTAHRSLYLVSAVLGVILTLSYLVLASLSKLEIGDWRADRRTI
ncbi:MAG: DUF1361 domain-containing protein [Chloroflexota bacterium]